MLVVGAAVVSQKPERLLLADKEAADTVGPVVDAGGIASKRDVAGQLVDLEAAASETPGIEFVSLRYGFFYGPGTWYSREGDMGEQARQQQIPIIGKGEGVGSFVHIDDAAAATAGRKKMLALYGLKWNPFAPDVPVEALHVTRRIESFCWRVQQLVDEGGFALVTGAPGTGKSVTLRILAERLGAQRDVKIGIVTRPQAGLADFYREMGDLFGVELAPHNRWAGAKVLRDRWQTHIDAALSRPVLIVDEAQEMPPAVLAELRLLSNARR